MRFMQRRRRKGLSAEDRDALLWTFREEAGESLRAAALALDLGLGGQPIMVVVTATQVLWALLSEPTTIMRMRLERITSVEQDGPRIHLTEHDPEYVRQLNDPANPFGETDFIFRLADSDEGMTLSAHLNLGLFQRSPVYETRRSHIQALRDRQGVPVGSWDDCPFCHHPFSSKKDGAVSCEGCERCFCDPGLEPVISEEPAIYGHIVSVVPWQPLVEAQVGARGKTTAWIIRPRGINIGPLVLLDTETVDLMGVVP